MGAQKMSLKLITLQINAMFKFMEIYWRDSRENKKHKQDIVDELKVSSKESMKV